MISLPLQRKAHKMAQDGPRDKDTVCKVHAWHMVCRVVWEGKSAASHKCHPGRHPIGIWAGRGWTEITRDRHNVRSGT